MNRLRLFILLALALPGLGFTQPAIAQAVRCTIAGSCGSGWCAGRDDRGTFVMTNAHVVGTELGRQVTIDVPGAAGVQRLTGRVILAAYHSQKQTDWAVLVVQGLDGPVWPLSIERPNNVAHQSTGSPRCVWPLVEIVTRDNQISGNSPLWTWLPSSIGGQSGSAVVLDGVAYGLLTWQINGRGAGQQTSWMYRQAQNNTSDAPARVEGMIELEKGVLEMDDETECQDGFFREVGFRDLPIWHGLDPVHPDDPMPDDPVGPLVKRLCLRLGIDEAECVVLLKLILRLLDK